MSGIESLTVEDMEMRIGLGDTLVAALEREPGSADAIDILRGQQDELRREIAKRKGEPPPVIVHLKTADLSAVQPDEGD